MRRRKTGFGRLCALVILGAVLYGTTNAGAASPQGVLKQAIHWGLSADWLDPSTASYVTTANHPLYLFHDALLKAMPEGNYPEIQALWDQYQREYSPKERKDLISRIQKMTHDKTIWLPLTSTNSPAGFGPRVKGNPYKVQPLLWFTAPFEDIELAK